MKSKERRDTLLLIAMAIIFILFLVYLFVPLGHRNSESAEGRTDGAGDQIKKPRIRKTGQDFFLDLNRRIETELAEILVSLKKSPQPFRDYPVDGLKKILFPSADPADISKELIPLYEVINKASRINFYDLKDIFEFDFPKGADNTLIFNLYTALFMIKLREENVLREIHEFPDTVFKRIVNCCPYLRIKNEIEKDFQSLPVLFYFSMLLQRLDMFPVNDAAAFLKERIGDIRDLSPGKIIGRVASWLNFSQDPRIYRITWTEEDDLNPNDHKSYPNLKINTYTFLGRKYLVFPDYMHPENNEWIRDLQKSDSGNIELVDFQLFDEDPVKNIHIQAIYYAPGTSRFVVLLDKRDLTGESYFPGNLVYHRLRDVRQYFLTVNFVSRFNDVEAFKTELINFGHFIKKQISAK